MKFHITPNDPCYCGSGKKYKYCCRDNPKPNADFLKEYYVHWQRGRVIDGHVLEFFVEMGSKFNQGVADMWWENPFLDEEEIQIFAEELGDEGFERAMQTLFRLFFYGKADELMERTAKKVSKEAVGEFIYRDMDADAVQSAKRIAATPFDFLQILSTNPETCLLEMRRLSDETNITVIDRAMARHASAGLIIGARVLPYKDDIHVLETPVEFVIHASRIGAIREKLEWWHKEQFGKKPFDYLRALNASPLIGLFIAVALSHEASHPVLVNRSGHQVVFMESVFAIRDHTAVKDFLMECKDVALIDEDEQDAEFIWKDKKDTILGNLTLSAKQLRLETNSKERFKTFEKRLKKIPGVKLLEKSEKSVEQAMSKRDKMTPTASSNALPVTPEIRALIHNQLLEHYRTWSDEKLPALNGKTAREMVRTPQGRERVILLLTEMQGNMRNLSEDNAMYGFSLKFLADELGLTLPQSYWD